MMAKTVLLLVLAVLVAAPPASAALAHDYDVVGALVLPGPVGCGLSCSQVVAFRLFEFRYMPFTPDPAHGDQATWTHRAIVQPFDDVQARGPLGTTFTSPGAAYPHQDAVPAGGAFVPFVSPRGVEIDLSAVPWFTATPEIAPTFDRADLRTCPAPCPDLGHVGKTAVFVRPTGTVLVPEPSVGLLLISGVGALAWRLRRGR